MKLASFAVTCASGLLAQALLERMAKIGIGSDSIILLDKGDQVGSRLAYADTYITLLDQYEFDYEDLTAVLLLEADAELESLLQHADCYVLSHHPDERSVPLYISNTKDAQGVANKPCAIKLAGAELSTLMSVIQPLQKLSEFESIQVVNVLSAASFGKVAIDELASQTIDLLNSRDVNSSVFPLQLAFNMIPVATLEGQENQIQHLLESKLVKCSVQNIVTAAFHGMSISVCIEFARDVEINEIKSLFKKLPGVAISDAPVSPLTHCKSGTKLQIFNLFQQQNDAKRLQFWIISDWVRNGLVQNYLNVMEILLKSYL